MEFKQTIEEVCNKSCHVLRIDEDIKSFEIQNKDGEVVRTTEFQKNGVVPNFKFFVAKGVAVLGTLLDEIDDWIVQDFEIKDQELLITLPKLGECKVVFH